MTAGSVLTSMDGIVDSSNDFKDFTSSNDLALSGVGLRFLRIDDGLPNGVSGDSTLNGGFGVSDRDFDDLGESEALTDGGLKVPSIEADLAFEVVGLGDNGRILGLAMVWLGDFPFLPINVCNCALRLAKGVTDRLPDAPTRSVLFGEISLISSEMFFNNCTNV